MIDDFFLRFFVVLNDKPAVIIFGLMNDKMDLIVYLRN